MAIGNVYTLHSVQREGVASMIDQIMSQNIDSGLEDYIGGQSSVISPNFAALMEVRPLLSFTTSKLQTALDLCGLTGLQATSTNKLSLWFKKRASYAEYASGSTHRKFTVNNGLMVPRRLTARHGEPATIDYEIHPIGDATNPAALVNPVVITVASLAAGAGMSQLFTLGPVKLDGTQLDSVQEVTIDFGIDVIRLGTNGQIFPEFCAIREKRPTIEVVTHDIAHATDPASLPGVVATFGLLGGIAASTGLTVFLRKKEDDGSGNVANATTEHISITAADLRFKWTGAEAQDRADATMRLRFEPIDNTSTLWAINTAVAIS